jgi:Transglycosylase SLT domain
MKLSARSVVLLLQAFLALCRHVCSICSYINNSKWGDLKWVLIGAFSFSAPAWADVWGYIDERGVAHFASTKLDARYELYFRGDGVFDTQAGVQPVEALEVPRAVAVPSVSPKLIAFFEVSTHYKSVRHIVRDAAKTHNLDYELLKAIITAESGFDPRAVSPKGAMGLMQLMPPTAQRFGVVADSRTPLDKKLFDPKTNIAAGTRYLRYLVNLFPNRLDLAIAAYNAGEGAVLRAGKRIPNFKETQDYVRTVMQLYAALKPPQTAPAPRPAPTQPERVRMELPNRVLGGAGAIAGRGNMVPPVGQGAALSIPAVSATKAAAAASQSAQ